MQRSTYLLVVAAGGHGGEVLDSADRSIDGLELDSEEVNIVLRVNVVRLSHVSELLADGTGNVGHLLHRLGKELGDDAKTKFDLTFELVNRGHILELGHGVVAGCDEANLVAQLAEDLLGFAGVLETVEADADGATKKRDRLKKDGVLGTISWMQKRDDKVKGGQLTCFISFSIACNSWPGSTPSGYPTTSRYLEMKPCC